MWWECWECDGLGVHYGFGICERCHGKGSIPSEQHDDEVLHEEENGVRMPLRVARELGY